MEAVGKPWTSSLRAKVLVPVIAVFVFMLVVTVWFVNHRLNLQIEADARAALTTDETVFRTLQANHLNYLRVRFQSLANEPKNRAALGTLDFNTIQKQLESIVQDENALQQSASMNEHIAFVLFTPENSAAEKTEPMIQPDTASDALAIASKLNVQRAMHPDDNASPTLSDTVAVGDKLYNLVSVRVYTPEHILLGVLTVGEEAGLFTAQEYFQVTGKPIIFMANGKPVLSTFSGRLDAEKAGSWFLRTTSGGAGKPDGVIRVEMNNDHFFCASGQFSSLKKDASNGYLLFNSYDPSASALQTQQLLLAACLVVILCGSVVVWYFVNRALRPLRELRASAEAVGQGDFSKRVKVRSRDEFGQLASAFNHMTDNVRQSQTELQQTVNTLKTTQAQLVQSEKLSAVGEFVAGVAHELNNPLAAVMGFSELLKNADVDEKYRRQLDLIFKSAVRCRKIVQSLLSFARRHQPERKPVSVNQLIEEVLEIVAYQLRTSNVQVDCKFAPDLPQVLADGHQIQQVILNLVNNARQAIEAHQGKGCITVATELRNHFIRIAIQDDGPGISKENLSRIFDPFFTTKEVGKGTGLGLSLCYGLIKEHGGSIHAASQPGQGAIFTIELPVSSDAISTSGPTTNTENVASTDGSGKKVLLVDDEDILLEMVRAGLQRHSYEVIAVINGEAALRELCAQKIDVVCSDIKMPGMNGRQLYDNIRTRHPEAARRVIFMTGDVVNPSLQLFLEQEQLVCLNKPFAMNDLCLAIKKVVNGANGH